MVNTPVAGQRPVWLGDKTKPIMDCSIAGEQSLASALGIWFEQDQ